MYIQGIWVTVLCVTVSLSNAQNARINALGGNFCIDDISSVLQNPAASVYYSDAVQGTAYQDGTFGPVIGIKSIGKRLSVGFAANVPDDFQSTYYSDARMFLDSTVDTQSVVPEKFPPYPHLIAAINLSFITVGGEAFYKRVTHESAFNENGTVRTVKKEITCTGININTSIVLGKIGIYPFAMYAVPSMAGSVISSDPDSAVTTSISANRSVKCGLELGFSPGRFIFTIGGILFNENYTFQSIGSLVDKSAANFVNAIDLYGGITTYPSDHILLSIVYDFNHGSYVCNSDESNNNAKQTENKEWIEKYHFAVASCEMTHNVSSINMNVFFRAGINWLIGTTVWKSEYHEEDYDYDENIKYPGINSQVTPTVGIGCEWGLIKFDIASKLADWSGIVSGMPVVTGTLTLDFSKAADK